MTTEGTALQGLLQQEREVLEREKGAATENGSPDPTAGREAKLDEGLQKEEFKPPNPGEAEGVQSEPEPLRQDVTT